MAIDVVDTGHNAFLELMFRGHPDVTQDGAGELGEEAHPYSGLPHEE